MVGRKGRRKWEGFKNKNEQATELDDALREKWEYGREPGWIFFFIWILSDASRKEIDKKAGVVKMLVDIKAHPFPPSHL